MNSHKDEGNIILAGDFNCMHYRLSFQIFEKKVPDAKNLEFNDNESEIMSDIHKLYNSFDFNGLKKLNLFNVYSKYNKYIGGWFNGFPEYTNYCDDFKETIDHIFISNDSFHVSAILRIPTIKDIQDYQGIPCEEFPSDHFMIGAEFSYK